MCIFSTPSLFAGIREIYPQEYEALRQDEKVLGFTLDNRKCLDDFVGAAKSCVYWKDKAAVRSIQTGAFSVRQVYVKDWKYAGGGVPWGRGRTVLRIAEGMAALRVIKI